MYFDASVIYLIVGALVLTLGVFLLGTLREKRK